MKYRVKALSLSGLNKKMFDSGDIVSEENFPEGNVPRLIAEGFLEEIPEEKAVEESEKEETSDQDAGEVTEDSKEESTEEEKPVKGKKKK